MAKHATILVVAALGLVCSTPGCEFSKPLTPRYAEEHGSRDYPQDLNTVYAACVTALQSSGFALRVDRPDLGRLETGPQLTSARGVVVQDSVIIESNADAWTLQLVRTQAGTHVTAYPRQFDNGVEYDVFLLSRLDQRWGPLFAAIDNYLPR